MSDAEQIITLRASLRTLLENFDVANRGGSYDAMALEGARALLNASDAEITRAIREAVLSGIESADLGDVIRAEAGRQGPERLAEAISAALPDGVANIARHRHYGD